MGSKGRTEERDYKTKSSAAKRCKKREQLLQLLAGDCFPALVPNWPLPPSRAPRLARLLHRARISLYVQFRKYAFKKISTNGLYTYGGCNSPYVDTVWALYEYVTVNFCCYFSNRSVRAEFLPLFLEGNYGLRIGVKGFSFVFSFLPYGYNKSVN